MVNHIPRGGTVDHPFIRIHVLPGGALPMRQTPEAIGYDVYARAIVSPTQMDPANPNLRLTVFDFITIPDDEHVRGQVFDLPGRDGRELVYRLAPNESVLVGVGFVTQMTYPMSYWVAPRSGLASKYGIQVTNAPGTVGPDYRGEAGVLVLNRGPHHFDLRRGMRIAQIIFQTAIIPSFDHVETFEELAQTQRHTGGFGSTGL
jgi:dUTP pyrophosphatase